MTLRLPGCLWRSWDSRHPCPRHCEYRIEHGFQSKAPRCPLALTIAGAADTATATASPTQPPQPQLPQPPCPPSSTAPTPAVAVAPTAVAPLPPTATAAEAAAAVGVPTCRIAKSIAVLAAGKPWLAAVRGDRRLDWHKAGGGSGLGPGGVCCSSGGGSSATAGPAAVAVAGKSWGRCAGACHVARRAMAPGAVVTAAVAAAAAAGGGAGSSGGGGGGGGASYGAMGMRGTTCVLRQSRCQRGLAGRAGLPGPAAALLPRPVRGAAAAAATSAAAAATATARCSRRVCGCWGFARRARVCSAPCHRTGSMNPRIDTRTAHHFIDCNARACDSLPPSSPALLHCPHAPCCCRWLLR